MQRQRHHKIACHPRPHYNEILVKVKLNNHLNNFHSNPKNLIYKSKNPKKIKNNLERSFYQKSDR